MATANLTVPIILNWKDVEGYLAQHDIVEVVRCKDCRHYLTGMFCEAWADLHPHAETYPEIPSRGYCHLAERRTDE